MGTVFDRFLFRRFLHVFLTGFMATYGLFVVIDAFTNLDNFQERVGSGGLVLFERMGEYYLYQSSAFFDLIGPILTVISVMVVFAMLHRSSEIKPILAAGVPTYRLVVPLIAAVALTHVLLAVNQELVIPNIADKLLAQRGTEKAEARTVKPVHDFETHIHITGEQLHRPQRMMRHAEFTLPAGDLAHEITTLSADQAVYVKNHLGHPQGWVLREVHPAPEAIPLTERGTEYVLREKNGKDVFVVTNVSFAQLYNHNREDKYCSTRDLIQRIRMPSTTSVSIRAQIIHLHERLTRPLAGIVAVFVTIPLIVRREGVSLVENIAVCTAVLGLLLGVSHGAVYLGKVNLISPELSVWAPIIISGAVGAWLSSYVQT